MTKIYIWPDGSWCTENELEDALQWKSDDHRIVEVSDDWDLGMIHGFVDKLRKGEL